MADLPIVVVPGGELLRNASNHAVLGALGLAAPPADNGGPPRCATCSSSAVRLIAIAEEHIADRYAWFSPIAV